MSLHTLLARCAVAVVLATVVPAASAQAQAPSRSAIAPSASRADMAAPSRSASVAGVRLQVTADAPRPPALAAGNAGRGQTLAIVGGAAFLGGLLIGDDAGTAIAIGGLAVGVYGLWLWLK